VPQIAGDEVRTAGFDSCQKDGDVFFGQVDASRQLARRGVKKIEVLRKPVEAAALGNFGEVDTGFFQGITGSAKLNIGQLPKPQEARVGTIRGGEQDIGVKEEPVHGGGLFGRTVGDGVGVEAEAFDFAAGPPVVGSGCGGGKKEFGLALRRVLFNRNDDGGAKEDAVLAGFGGDEGAFVETEALAELRGDDDRAAFADFGGFHEVLASSGISECQIFGHASREK